MDVSDAMAINDLGVIAGQSYVLYGLDQTATVYMNGITYNLNLITTNLSQFTSGVPTGVAAIAYLTVATAINDAGQILVSAGENGGPFASFLLSPVKK